MEVSAHNAWILVHDNWKIKLHKLSYIFLLKYVMCIFVTIKEQNYSRMFMHLQNVLRWIFPTVTWDCFWAYLTPEIFKSFHKGGSTRRLRYSRQPEDMRWALGEWWRVCAQALFSLLPPRLLAVSSFGAILWLPPRCREQSSSLFMFLLCSQSELPFCSARECSSAFSFLFVLVLNSKLSLFNSHDILLPEFSTVS